MKVLTWNIQATKGCDGRFDLNRIVTLIKAYSNLDVICLQEVSKHIPDLNNDDQPSLITAQFPGYEATWAPGFSVPEIGGKRSEFGNLTLVKKPLLKWSRVHSLPSPFVTELQMPRTMVEVAVGDAPTAVTIFNAHLAFHSSVERVAQIQALTLMRDTIISNAVSTKAVGAWGPYSFKNESPALILCGDLNVDSESAEFKEHISDRNWIDCGAEKKSIANGKNAERQPTVGCFDRIQWPQGPHVTDYFLATQSLAKYSMTVSVDVETDASDHQPVLLEVAL